MSAKKTSSSKPGLRSRAIAILAGAGAVAYALLVYVPQRQSIARMRTDLRDKQSQIMSSELLAQPVLDLQDKLAKVEQFATMWRSIAPHSHNVSPLYAQVIVHARETGAEIMSFTPLPEQPLENIGMIPVAVQAAGSYRCLHQFVQRLEGMPGVVWVDDLRLQPQGSDEQRLQCTLKLVIFADRGKISG